MNAGSLTSSLLRQHCPPSWYSRLRGLHYRTRKGLSQFGQDFWVFGEAFCGKQNGFFLEIGAADGLSLSNTYLLEKRYHWRGMCIEANPVLFRDLERVRSARCLNVCVDIAEAEADFVLRGLHSGIMADDTDNRRAAERPRGERVIRVKTRDLASILREENAPRTIDYFSIDVEGAEDRILSGFAFGEYTFNSMTAERPGDSLRGILQRKGYILIKEIPGYHAFYVHESFKADYVENAEKFYSTAGS